MEEIDHIKEKVHVKEKSNGSGFENQKKKHKI